LQAGTGAVVRTAQAKLRETVSVKDFGAKGDGVTDDTAAIRLAFASGALTVVFPAKTFLLTNQITVPANVKVMAYGAILKWTCFGNTLASTVAEFAATGNGIRMLSGSAWYGGKLQMNGVATPSNRSIPSGSFSGAFWNQFAIGHFNTVTTADMSVETTNVLIRDVETELVSGSRASSVFVAGLTNNVRVENVVDNHTSTSIVDMTVVEVTWGADSTYTYHPYNIRLENMRMNGYSGAYTALNRGIHISGAYDVSSDHVYAKNLMYPFTFYIGDPGDGSIPTTSGKTIYPANAGKICTGLKANAIYADNFDIGIRILGDANGTTESARGTHDVPAVITDICLIGQGIAAGTASWSSNIGVYISDASKARISNGQIKNTFQGINFKTPAAGATFTAPDSITIECLNIKGTVRQGISSGTIKNVRILNNNISGCGVGSTTTSAACIRVGGAGNRVAFNKLGQASDTAITYGIVDLASDATKADDVGNVSEHNHCEFALTSAFAMSYMKDEWTNTAATGVPRSFAFVNPDVVVNKILFNNNLPFISQGTGSPEGAVTARISSLYFRLDGGSNTSVYIKESGTGNTGWVAK
jgi:hypothetical protein